MSPTIVSTDGSCLSNPNGPMGWAWADYSGGRASGGAANGTNQIAELSAVLMALRAHRDCGDLLIETDSQYAIKASTEWLPNWKRNGWRNAKKQPVKNADLIRAIDHEMISRDGSVSFKWVKGHAGNEYNEIVDDLARGAAESWANGSDSPNINGIPQEAVAEVERVAGKPAEQIGVVVISHDTPSTPKTSTFEEDKQKQAMQKKSSDAITAPDDFTLF